MLLLRSTATHLGLSEGDRFTVLVQSRYTEAELVGLLDYFPTVRVEGDAGFGLVNLDRLLYAVNEAPGQGGTAPNVVPQTAELQGTMRTYTAEQGAAGVAAVEAACRAVADDFGLKKRAVYSLVQGDFGRDVF